MSKVIHGHTSRSKPWSSEYKAWAAMVRRCTNPRQSNYPYYGGRGITVCPAWLESFKQFFADMGSMPSDGKWSLDRIDPNGNYEPGNCRWASRETQMNNRRDSRLLTHDSKTLGIPQWSRLTGISIGTIVRRLKLGWPHSRVLTEKPVRGRNQFTSS